MEVILFYDFELTFQSEPAIALLILNDLPAIHRAAGPDLLQACYSVPEVRPGVRCPTGEARITL